MTKYQKSQMVQRLTFYKTDASYGEKSGSVLQFYGAKDNNQVGIQVVCEVKSNPENCDEKLWKTNNGDFCYV